MKDGKCRMKWNKKNKINLWWSGCCMPSLRFIPLKCNCLFYCSEMVSNVRWNEMKLSEAAATRANSCRCQSQIVCKPTTSKITTTATTAKMSKKKLIKFYLHRLWTWSNAKCKMLNNKNENDRGVKNMYECI